jgi:thymidylate kinase
VPNVGKLYVFEGPDGVGKTALSIRFAEWLIRQGIRCERVAFPGTADGSLGKHIYHLHHEPDHFDVAHLTPTSKQLLHVAAHIDAIETVIHPLLHSGDTVVLDRYWWSTRVYGLISGVGKKALDSMIDLELSVWGHLQPSAVFLLRRNVPPCVEPLETWAKLRQAYDEVAADQISRYAVYSIDNEGTLDDALATIQAIVGKPQRTDDTPPQLPLTFTPPAALRRAPYAFTALAPVQPTIVYDTYWRFASERQAVFFRRKSGGPPPWTDDPILSEYKFTNAYRASDRVSQYLIREVIYQGDPAPQEVFFRTILFKLFNKIETWQLLQQAFCTIQYKQYCFEKYDRVLSTAINAGKTIYSAAYIMPSGSRALGTTRKHRAHLYLLQRMMEDDVAFRLADAKTMRAAFDLLRSYPMLGDFLAYQYVTDLNYSTLTNFDEMEFVVPGPGARSGIAKCMASRGGLDETDIIKLVTDRQQEEFRRLGLQFQPLWDRPLQLIDCQNLFCEVDKYARIRHPEIPGNSTRTRIKQRFRPTLRTINYWYPPKWGINDRVVSAAYNGE